MEDAWQLLALEVAQLARRDEAVADLETGNVRNTAAGRRSFVHGQFALADAEAARETRGTAEDGAAALGLTVLAQLRNRE